MFHVYLLPTPNLSAHGECLLQVTTQDVTLHDGNDQSRVLARWPLPALRRFGREGAKFTIESGRSLHLMDSYYLLVLSLIVHLTNSSCDYSDDQLQFPHTFYKNFVIVIEVDSI